MVSLRIHGTVKSFVHPTYGLHHESKIDVNRSTINALQFNNQLDHRSITKLTNVGARFEPGYFMTERDTLPTKLSTTD
jgi:hypothetical protein